MASLGGITIDIEGNAEPFLRALRGALSSIGSIAAKAGGIGLALAAAVPQAAALASAIASIGPALALVPALITGIGAAMATLVIGFQGIGTAFSSLSKASASAASDAAAQSKAVAAAAKQVEAAQRGVESALRGVASAEKALADANKDAKNAQEDLTRARKEAREELEDLQLTLKGAALSEKDAQLSLKESQLAYASLDPNASALERERAALRVEQAEQRLAETQERNGDLAEEAADKQKKGVEGSDQVVAAKERLAAANDRVKDAEQGVADAQQAVADAQRNLADAQAAVAEAMNQTSSAAEAAQKALDDLSDNARDFVLQMREFGDEWRDLRIAVQDNLFESLGDDMAQVARVQIPALKAGLGEIATGLNKDIRAALKVFGEQDVANDFQTTLTNIGMGFGSIAPGIESLVRAWVDLATVGSEFLTGTGGGFNQWAKDFADNIARLRDTTVIDPKTGEEVSLLHLKIQGALDTLKAFWETLKDVGGIIGGVFKAAGESTEGALGPLSLMLDKLNETVNSVQGQNALVSFFNGINQAVEALAPILGTLADILFTTIVPALADLLTAAGPGLQDAVKGIGTLFEGLAPLMEPIGTIISGIGSAVQTFIEAAMPGIDAFVGSFKRLTSETGPFASVMPKIEALVSSLGRAFGVAAQLLGALFEFIAPVVAGFISALAPALTLVLDAFSWLGEKIAPVVSWLADKLEPVLHFVGQALAFVVGSIVALIGRFGQFLGALSQTKAIQLIFAGLNLAWHALVAAFEGGWDFIKGAFTAAWGFIKPVIDGIGVAFTWLWENAIKPAIDGISAAFSFVWDYIINPIFEALKIALAIVATAFLLWWEGVKFVLDAWWTLFQWIWDTIIQPIWEGIKIGIQLVGEAFSWVWNNLIKPAWDALGAGIQFVWDTIISPVWEFMKAGLNVLGEVFNFIWNNIIKPAWDALGAGIRFVWDTFVSPVWELIKAGLGLIGDAFSFVWNSVIKPVWDALGAGIQWVWDTLISPVFDAMKMGVDLVAKGFEKAADWIGDMWDKIKAFAAKPIAFVIQKVYNEGVVKAWNTVAKWVGVEGLDEYKPAWMTEYGYKTGGVLPGYTPGRDVHEFYSPGMNMKLGLSGGEAIMRPEFTRAVGADTVDSLNSAARSGGVSGVRKKWMEQVGYADGGVLNFAGGTNGFSLTAEQTRMWETFWPFNQSAVVTDAGIRNWDDGTGGASYHYTGEALDIGGPDMGAYTNWIYANDPDARELFYDPWGGLKNGQQIGAIGGHGDHVHWVAGGAIGDGKGGFVPGGSGAGGGGGADPALWRQMIAKAWDLVMDGIDTLVPDSLPPGGIIGTFPQKTVDWVRDSVRTKILDEGEKNAPKGGASIGAYGGNADTYAAAIVDSGKAHGLDAFGTAIGIATALVESNLRMYANNAVPESLNYPHDAVGSDHDSVGLFQQRPHWGPVATLMNARGSADLFYNAMLSKFPNWQSMDRGAVAQGVQVSAYPDKYGQRMGEADALTARFFANGGIFDKGGIMRSGQSGTNMSGKPERVLSPAQTEAFDAFVGWVTGKNDWNMFAVELGEAIGEACAKPVADAAESGVKAGTEASGGAGGTGSSGIGSSPVVANAAAGMIEELTEGMLRNDQTLYDERTTGLTDAELEQKKKEQWEAIFGEGSADNLSFADVNGRNAIRWNGQLGHDMGDKAGSVPSGSTGTSSSTAPTTSNTTTVHAPITYHGDADFDALLRDFGSRLLALLDH